MTRFKRFILVFAIVFGGFFCLFDFKDPGLCLIIAIFASLLSLPYDTKAERKEKKAAKKAKEEARKREEDAKERARKASGCYSMDNVDILTFSSANNLFTVGNNFIKIKLRNRNPYDVIVSICYKYSDSEGWDSSCHSFEVGGNKIRTIDTQGTAWRRAKDVSIVAVH